MWNSLQRVKGAHIWMFNVSGSYSFILKVKLYNVLVCNIFFSLYNIKRFKCNSRQWVVVSQNWDELPRNFFLYMNVSMNNERPCWNDLLFVSKWGSFPFSGEFWNSHLHLVLSNKVCKLAILSVQLQDPHAVLNFLKGESQRQLYNSRGSCGVRFFQTARPQLVWLLRLA